MAETFLQEERSYFWEETGPDSARAHQGGRLIRRRSSRKLVLGLEAAAGRELVLSRLSRGSDGYRAGPTMGTLLVMRQRKEFRTVAQDIGAGLRAAGLA